MRFIARLIIVVSLAAAYHPLAAVPIRESHLLFNPLSITTACSNSVVAVTPLDSLRSHFIMQETSDIKSVLAYLRGMVERCREANRRDLVAEYEEAVHLVADRMYGKLPPRTEKNYLAIPIQPHVITTALSKSAMAHSQLWADAPVLDHKPVTEVTWTKSKTTLRKITRRYWKPGPSGPIPYEVLACGHEQTAPVGYSILHKSRYCSQCKKQNAAVAKKKPASVKVAHTNTDKNEQEVSA